MGPTTNCDLLTLSADEESYHYCLDLTELNLTSYLHNIMTESKA